MLPGLHFLLETLERRVNQHLEQGGPYLGSTKAVLVVYMVGNSRDMVTLRGFNHFSEV